MNDEYECTCVIHAVFLDPFNVYHNMHTMTMPYAPINKGVLTQSM